jgi:hypothetical protein
MWISTGLALTVLHFAYGSQVGLEVFRQRGGFTDIGGGWMAIGGVERSWSPVAWLPAGVPFYLAAESDLLPLASVGFMLLVCGSAGAAISSIQVVRALISSPERRLGRYAWKLWLLMLLWLAWVPVPFTMTWTYWHTVRY